MLPFEFKQECIFVGQKLDWSTYATLTQQEEEKHSQKGEKALKMQKQQVLKLQHLLQVNNAVQEEETGK